MRSRRNLRFFAGILALSVLAPVWAQTDWEGTAAVGRYGEFPPGGLYVASNTFPLNSLIDVTNPSTGRRARLIVVRETGDSGVFLLLSEAAASALGVSGDATTTVRATPVQLPGLTSVDPNQDLPFHPDPDVNPSASLGDPNAAIVMPQALQDDAGSTPETAAEAPSVSPAESVAAAEAAATADAVPEVAAGPEPTMDPPAVAATPPEVEPEPEAEPAPEAEPEPEPATPDDEIAPSAGVAVAPAGAMGEETGAVPESEPAMEEATADETTPEDAPSVQPAAPEMAPPSLAVVIDSDDSEEAPPTQDTGESETVAETGPVMTPDTSIIAAPRPETVDEFGDLPEVDLAAAIMVDVTDPVPDAPNPVQVVVELPQVEEMSTPQLSEVMPERPVLEENEIALPIAPLEEIESEPSLATPVGAEDEPVASALPEPREPVEAVEAVEPAEETSPEREPLRPGLIPEDAIVSLEPAEFRSPDPPEPTVEDVVAETPTEEALEVPENIAVVIDDEPEAEEAPSPDSEEIAVAEPERSPEPVAEPAPAPIAVAEETTGIGDLPIVSDLDRGASWVQVAAFTNPQSVRRTIDTLGDGVPVAVLSQPSGSSALYRVYVGPLSEDEKGSMLYRVRSRGFRDAFVR
jgi:hypothetical protein